MCIADKCKRNMEVQVQNKCNYQLEGWCKKLRTHKSTTVDMTTSSRFKQVLKLFI